MEPPARPLPRGRRAARRGGREGGGRTERAPACPAPLPLWLRPGLDPLSSLGPGAHLPGKWHPSPLRPRPPSQPHPPPPPPPLRRASGLCLRPRSSGSGCGCDSRAQLSGSAYCAARRGKLGARSMGRTGPARSAPGVKLRSSLGSGENLLKPGAAHSGDGGAGDGTGSRFLGPSGVSP